MLLFLDEVVVTAFSEILPLRWGRAQDAHELYVTEVYCFEYMQQRVICKKQTKPGFIRSVIKLSGRYSKEFRENTSQSAEIFYLTVHDGKS